jgi:hypothetical protein
VEIAPHYYKKQDVVDDLKKKMPKKEGALRPTDPAASSLSLTAGT